MLDLADVLPSRRLLCEALVARFARAVPVNVVDQLGALVNPDLLVHVADVGVHRVGGNDELFATLPVVKPRAMSMTISVSRAERENSFASSLMRCS